MEKIPDRGREAKKGGLSGFQKGARAALAGLAGYAAVSAESPKALTHLPQMQTVEAHEAFDANKEADMFIAEIETLDFPDDAQGQNMLNGFVEEDFHSFVIALKTRIPHFSAQGSYSIHPTHPILEDIERAKNVLRPKLAIDKTQTPGMAILRSIVGEKALTPQQLEGIRAMRRSMEGSAPEEHESVPNSRPTITLPMSPMEPPQDMLRQGQRQMEDALHGTVEQQENALQEMEREQQEMLRRQGFPGSSE